MLLISYYIQQGIPMEIFSSRMLTYVEVKKVSKYNVANDQEEV